MSRRAGLALLAALAVPAFAARGQVPPHARWRTIDTPHFRVHFTADVEAVARRTAAAAERAWTELARTYRPPRGPVELVVSDNVDFTNGYATVYPTNRIVLYAHPPATPTALRFTEDWMSMLVLHELTHIFHLDRTRGWWRVAQSVFGRDPLWFPNLYLPTWLIEGLAVHEESHLTGAGRSHGTHHAMVARAAASDRRVPRLDELSAGSSRFPQGEMAYVYGALLFDHLARRAGERAVGRFVERTSRAPIPFLLDRQARGSFGVGFRSAWRAVRDSLAREMRGTGAEEPTGERVLTDHAWFAWHPRWMSDTVLAYSGTTGRETPGLYVVDLAGRRRRIAERNGMDPNDPISGGWLWSQPELLDPWTMRSDLWRDQRGRRERLTRGARLTWPDARGDGLIVATQAVPGATRLVLVAPDGSRILPLTRGTDDEWWSQARWSPDGRWIAAIRQTRGPVSEVVVLDTTGAIVSTAGTSRAVVSTPSPSADGRQLYFVSDAARGRPEVHVVPLDPDGRVTGPPVRVTSARTGHFDPAPGPDGRTLAGVTYRSDGYHLALLEMRPAAGVEGTAAPPRPVPPPAAPDSSPARSYRPWRTLLPRYWRPLFSVLETESLIGAVTTGTDVIGRHEYAVEGWRHLSRPEWDAAARWTWRGLGQPSVSGTFVQSWRHYARVTRESDGAPLGTVRERTRDGSITLGWSRPRIRSSMSTAAGVDGEWFVYATEPRGLIGAIDPAFARQYRTFGAFGGASFVRARRPPLAISLEDGVAGSLLLRHRRDPDDGVSWNGAVATLSGFRALDLPGFSHHVLAVRIAAGVYDGDSRSDHDVGGLSGQALELLPGIVIGGGSSSFPVRGFAEGTVRGTRAASASLEYRAPLLAPSRGIALFPAFFDRAALVVFGDAGVARCSNEAPVCGLVDDAPPAIASAGAELLLDAALQYDLLYRFRAGVAAPVTGRELAANRITVYLTLGSSF